MRCQLDLARQGGTFAGIRSVTAGKGVPTLLNEGHPDGQRLANGPLAHGQG